MPWTDQDTLAILKEKLVAALKTEGSAEFPADCWCQPAVMPMSYLGQIQLTCDCNLVRDFKEGLLSWTQSEKKSWEVVISYLGVSLLIKDNGNNGIQCQKPVIVNYIYNASHLQYKVKIKCHMKVWSTMLAEQRNVDFHWSYKSNQSRHLEGSSIHIDSNMQKWRRDNESKAL